MGKETFIPKQNRCGFFHKKIDLTVMLKRSTLYKPLLFSYSPLSVNKQ